MVSIANRFVLDSYMIEYIPGLNPGDKIDLNALGKKKMEDSLHSELFLSSLQEVFRNIAKRPEYAGIMDSEGKVKMLGAEAEKDLEYLIIKEKAWAREKGLSHGEWLLKKESNPANLAEMGITALLDRFLGDRFAVLRASDYDDYENGADNLIIDRESGAVICGIDDVISREGNDGENKKEDKVLHKMKRGGARLKYGLALKEGNLVPAQLRNVPIFYLSISKPELTELLSSLCHNDSPGVVEKRAFSQLMESMISQYHRFIDNDHISDRSLRANLESLEDPLEAMRAVVKDQFLFYLFLVFVFYFFDFCILFFFFIFLIFLF